MGTKNKKLDEIGIKNPFRTPEGYFENFSENLVSCLPDKEFSEQKVVNLWEKVRPWVYMAAMFVGIMLMVNIFVGSPKEGSGILSGNVEEIPVNQIDEYYSYCQDQVAAQSYRQALYGDDL